MNSTHEKAMIEASTKAVIYCRVSDPKQRTEGHGLESQELRCRQYAEQHSLQVAAVFCDDVSGGGDYAKRPGMTALLHFLETHPHKSYTVVFDDLKRLARDTLFHWQLRHAISDYGARVECLNYKFDNTPEGEFMETLFAAQGQLERKQNRRQVVQKMKARLESGFYVFAPPAGYQYQKDKAYGKILVPDEPVASIITEMMKGFASGRFQTKEEARRFLEHSPEFPKVNSGKVGNNKVKRILTNPIYAGYVEYKPWGISLNKGQHEGLVDFETFQSIQERLKGRAYAPTKANLNQDFPLRNFVSCECGNALTAAWSKSKTGKRHPYYLCQNRKCEYKGKSIRRDVLEGEFEKLLKRLTPSKPLFVIADKMFRKLWAHREQLQTFRQKHYEKERVKLDKQIDQLLNNIVEAQSPTVMRAFEKKIESLEKSKLILEEKIAQTGHPVRPFEKMYRTSMQYLAQPHKVWASGLLGNWQRSVQC